MKKLLIVICFMLGLAGITSAQQPAKKPAEKNTVTKPAASATTAKPAATTATAAKTTTTPQTAKVDKAQSGAPKKADGTPDMRYKENKAKPATTGPTKKDGTPDKRYKANKKG